MPNLLCVKYYHLKQSPWLKHLNKLIILIENHDSYKYVKSHPYLTALLAVCATVLWVGLILCGSKMTEMDARASDAAVARRARQRVINIGMNNPLTPYEEELMILDMNKQNSSKLLVKFWKLLSFFTKKYEKDLTEELDVAKQGHRLLEQKDLSSSELFLDDLGTMSMMTTSSLEEDDLRVLP